MQIARIIDSESGFWWSKFYNVEFQVLSIRTETIIVKSTSDEDLTDEFSFHELPKQVVELYTV